MTDHRQLFYQVMARHLMADSLLQVRPVYVDKLVKKFCEARHGLFKEADVLDKIKHDEMFASKLLSTYINVDNVVDEIYNALVK